MKAADLNIPSGHKFEVCGTGKMRKISGEIHMVRNDNISDDDSVGGYNSGVLFQPDWTHGD